jgi:hypothetical protein
MVRFDPQYIGIIIAVIGGVMMCIALFIIIIYNYVIRRSGYLVYDGYRLFRVRTGTQTTLTA